MNQQELEALLRQIAPGNNPGRLVFTQTVKPVKVTVPADPDVLGSKPTTKTVNVPVYQWVDPGTGHVLEVQQEQDGTYTVTKQGVDQSAIGKPAVTAEQQAAEQGGKIKKPVPGKPGTYEVTTKDPTTNVTETHYEDEAGNRVLTPTEPTGSVRTPVQGRPGYVQVTTKDPSTNQTETHYEDANGNHVQLPGEGGSVRKPVQGKPGIYEVTTKDATTNATETHYEDEQGNRVPTPTDAGAIRKPVQDHPGVYEVTTKDPATNTVETHFENESGQRVPTPADASKPVQVNGQWGVWKPNPNDPSGAPTFEPIQNAPSAYTSLPPGVPRFETNFTKPDLGLGDRKAQLDALVTQGVITPKQAQDTMTADAGNAKAGAENLGAIVTIQEQNRATGITQRGQDLGEQQSRRSFVGGLYSQAASGFNNSKVLPGAGAASANGFLAMMQAGMRMGQQAGGFRDVPRVENGPLLNQFGQATLTPSGSYTVPVGSGQSAASSSAAPVAAPSADDLPWLQHQPLTNSGAAIAPAAAPTTTISPSGEVTINHTPALLQPAPATTSGPLLAPPPLDPGETVTPQAGMWHPNHDGLIDDMVNAGFEPDAIAAAFPDLHRYGPSPSLVA